MWNMHKYDFIFINNLKLIILLGKLINIIVNADELYHVV